jgi:thiol:disulfide interchange protein
VNSMVKCARIVLLVLLLGLLFGGVPSCTSECDRTELYGVLSEAQSGNRPVMIDFYADWCVPCRQMDKDTYSDNVVSALLSENFIFLKVDVDKSKLDGCYDIKYLPTIVFLSPEGTEIGSRIIGYQPPGEFYQNVQDVLYQWRTQP